MKHIYTVALFLFFFSFLEAQSVQVDERVYELMPTEKVDWLVENRPSEIIYLNNVLEYGYEIRDGHSNMATAEITIDEINDINILNFGNAPVNGKSQFFYISNLDKTLRILDLEAFTKKINSLN